MATPVCWYKLSTPPPPQSRVTLLGGPTTRRVAQKSGTFYAPRHNPHSFRYNFIFESCSPSKSFGLDIAFRTTEPANMRNLFLVVALLLAIPTAHAANSPGGALDAVGVNAAGQTTVTVTNTAASALLANPNRKYLFIQNTGATNSVQCKFGGTFTASEGFVLAAGATFTASPAISSSVWCKSASGTTVNFIEGIQ